MKKAVIFLLVTILCFSCIACSGKTNEDTEMSQDTTASPVEKAKEKLSDAYESCCEVDTIKDYASLGYDKMSLTIDTKPDDSYYEYEDDAVSAIVAVNLFLELPSSLTDKMSSTRALDGMQTQNCGEYTVTWNYHPDNGLKVIYEVNP